MDTMDILMDMGMDIMVDKHNNQNAKIGLERTSAQIVIIKLQPKNKLHQIICSRSKNVKSTQQNFTMLVHISSVLFFSFCKNNSLDMILVHKKHKLYNFFLKKNHNATKVKR